MRSNFVVLLIAFAELALINDAAAQQKKMFRIGFLSPAASSSMTIRVERFKRGLEEFGYIDGKNTVMEYRWADGSEDRLKGLASELAPKVDLIVAQGVQAAQAAQQVSATMPIVCFGCGDAVSVGLVANLAHPGGNVTGQTTLAPEATGKRVELIKEAFPGITRLAVLWNAKNPVSGPELRETEEAARAAGLQLQSVSVGKPDELREAFQVMRTGNAEAVIVLSDAMFFGSRKQIADFAIAERIPAVSSNNAFTKSGFVLSYGPDIDLLAQRAAIYVDKILKGGKPADLPVEQPTRFEFVVNLKTARVLGFNLPTALLARADEVIE